MYVCIILYIYIYIYIYLYSIYLSTTLYTNYTTIYHTTLLNKSILYYTILYEYEYVNKCMSLNRDIIAPDRTVKSLNLNQNRHYQNPMMPQTPS